MTGSAGSAVDVLVNAIAFFNRRRVREEDRRRFCSMGGSADDGKRSEAEGTLCDDGTEERGVPGGVGTAAIPGNRVADRLKMVLKMDPHLTGSAAKRSGRCVMME